MEKKKPNIIFILSDQHNAKLMGHRGHSQVKTPHLDQMATEGVSFTNAITVNPICTPSRISWLSGQYCHNHGYYGLSGEKPCGLPTVLGHFRKEGYKTAAIGKIHCPEYWVEDDCDLFIETLNCSIGGNRAYKDYLYANGIEDLEDVAISGYGKKGIQSCDARAAKTPYKHSSEGFTVAKSIEFMGKCIEDSKPFFVHMSFPKPHQCYLPSKEFWDLYDDETIDLPPNYKYDMRHKAPHLLDTLEKWQEGDWTLFEPKTYEAGSKRKLHGYLGCISQVDHALGEVMEWITNVGIEEETIIIYSADHGDYACEHGIIEKAPGICSDAITRVPFIWKWKNHIVEHKEYDHIVESVDLVNTLCTLASIEPLETSDGIELSSLLKGKDHPTKSIGMTEFAWSKSMRMGNYRYVYYPTAMFPQSYPEGFGELYNVEKDPWEMENLYFHAEYKHVVEEMRGLLLEWLITTTRPKTTFGVSTCHPGMTINSQQYLRFHNIMNKDGKFHPGRIKEVKNKNYL